MTGKKFRKHYSIGQSYSIYFDILSKAIKLTGLAKGLAYCVTPYIPSFKAYSFEGSILK